MPLDTDNLSFSFSMWAEQVETPTPVPLAAVRFLGNENDALYTSLALKPPVSWTLNTAFFADLDAGARYALLRPVAQSDWVSIRFDVALTSRLPTNGELSLFVNDRFEVKAPLEAPFPVAVLQVCFGVVYADAPSGPYKIRYDNVRLDMW